MRDIFSVLRDYRLFGNDDEGGGGGGGSDKTYDSLADAAKDGQHGNYHQRPKERGQIGVDPFDADLRENRGRRGEAGGAQCPDEPGR